MSESGIVIDPAQGAGQAATQPTAQNTGDGFIVGAEPSAINERKTFDQQQQAQQGERTFTKEDIERARSEERDKLMKRGEKSEAALAEMREQLAVLQKEREEREAAAAAAEKARQDAEEAATREKMTAKEMIHKVEETMQEKFRQLEEQRQQAEVLLEKERQFHALSDYRNQRLADPEIRAAVAPQLDRYIRGNSQEEIDASIQAAIESTQSIFGEVQQVLQQQRQMAPGVSPYAPAGGPIPQEQQTQQLTIEQLKAMSPEEYERWRPQLLQQARPPR